MVRAGHRGVPRQISNRVHRGRCCVSSAGACVVDWQIRRGSQRGPVDAANARSVQVRGRARPRPDPNCWCFFAFLHVVRHASCVVRLTRYRCFLGRVVQVEGCRGSLELSFGEIPMVGIACKLSSPGLTGTLLGTVASTCRPCVPLGVRGKCRQGPFIPVMLRSSVVSVRDWSFRAFVVGSLGVQR